MNRLKELREDKDLFQKDIAKILNMSQTGYSQYETETNDIPTDILKKLADYYHTSIDYLLYRTDKRNPYPKSIVETKVNKKNKNSFQLQKWVFFISILTFYYPDIA